MSDLTPAQLKFLSKYLHVVPRLSRMRSSSKRVAEQQYNAGVEQDFLVYEAAKAKADGLLGEIKAGLAVARSAIGGLETGASPEVTEFLENYKACTSSYDALGKQVSAKHIEVTNAPIDAPIFIRGARDMASLNVNLEVLHGRLPEVPAILEDGVIGIILNGKREIGRLRSFDDISGLTPELVRIEIEADRPELQRQQALKFHADLCDLADEFLDEGLVEARKTQGRKPSDAILEEYDSTMTVLRSHRKVPIAELLKAVSASATEKMSALVAGNNPVALREKSRGDVITESVKGLDDKAKKLKTKIDALLVKLQAATSASEKKALMAEYKDACGNLDKLAAYSDQLKAYSDQLAARVKRITEAEMQSEAAGDLLANPDQYFIDHAAEISAMGISKIGASDQSTEISDEDAELTLIGDPKYSKYKQLLDKFTAASIRVSVDMKLFPGEPDLTDITQAQFAQLKAMLALGKSLAEGKKYDKANHIFQEAQRTFDVFNASNKFPLPDPAPAQVPADQAIAKEIKALTVALDRFWGRGGDADEALRNKLDAIVAARDAGADRVPENFRDANALIEPFKKELSAAIKAFQPNPQDVAAKKSAEAGKNELLAGMLDLYKTKPVQDSKVGEVPDDKLLVIERNGNIEYHKIITTRDGTKDERKNEDVPLEAMNRLYEQAYTLEVLAQSDAPDCGAMIEAAVAESKVMLKAISEGGPDYKYILARIKEVEDELPQKLFVAWAPVGLGTLKADLETFKSSYIEKLLPADARIEIDNLFKRIAPLVVECNGLAEKYDEVDAFIASVEIDLTSGKGTADLSLGKLMADLIKAGPEKLLQGFISKPSDSVEAAAIIEDLKVNLKAMADLGSSVDLKNDFAARLATARQSLNSKTDSGMESARDLAKAVRDEMVVTRAGLVKANSIDYLRALNDFLSGAASGAKELKEKKEQADALKKTVEAKLKVVAKLLKDKKATLGSYAEYKEVFDSIKDQYGVANKAYKQTKDATLALQQLNPINSDLIKLEKEVNNRTEGPKESSAAVDFTKAQTDLTVSITAVQAAAEDVATRLEAKAASNEASVQTTAAKAATVLRLVGDSKVADIFKFDSNMKGEAVAAMAQIAPKDKKDALNELREKALAEVRRMSKASNEHKALKIYRDNPIDHGSSWPPVASDLHSFDVDILKNLKP